MGNVCCKDNKEQGGVDVEGKEGAAPINQAKKNKVLAECQGREKEIVRIQSAFRGFKVRK